MKNENKQPYTIQVEEAHEKTIREYISQSKKETGMSRRRIATELILAGIATKMAS